MAIRIALAQVDVRLGDVDENARRARRLVEEAAAGGAHAVVFPELCLSGYALHSAGADTAIDADVAAAAVERAPAALIGFHERNGDATYNSAAWVEAARVVHVHRKLYLPHYLDFREGDLFRAGDAMRAFDTCVGRVAVLVCNDAWQPALPFLAVHDGARILLVPSASSTAVAGIDGYWSELTRFYARMLQCYVVFVNRVGKEGGFTFWGGSHVVGPDGELVAEAPRFEEALVFADLDLDRVEEQRRILPLVGDPRADLLRSEFERLGR